MQHNSAPKRIYLLLQSNKKAKAKTTKPKQSTKQQERRHLYETQQSVTIRRFPTRLSDREEIDRLKVCVAQCLAVMDRFLEFWEIRQCPFQDLPDKPDLHQTTQQTQHAVDTSAEVASRHDKVNHPYL